MKEFTCIICGAKGIDRGNGKRKFCSRECSIFYWGLQKGSSVKDMPSCQYNDWVACANHKCENCGWNPVVEKRRKKALV